MTGIQWTQEVWNPTTGCDKVSPGCGLPRFDGDGTGGCYAMAMAKRLKGMGQAKYQNDGDPRTSGPGFGLTVHPDVLELPLRWRQPRQVFVNSMSDLFHKDVPDEYIACVFTVMAKAQQHTFQLLTKRHGRMRSLLSSDEFQVMCLGAAASRGWDLDGTPWPLPNVHLGISAEDQHWLDVRLPALLATPAAVRWVSAEPLLGPISFWPDDHTGHDRDDTGEFPNGLTCLDCSGPEDEDPRVEWTTQDHVTGIDWLVAGGESGPGARPCELAWLRQLRDQCAETGTAFFCKQLGSVIGRQIGAGPKGGDINAFPEDLKVRQFPRSAEPVKA